MKNIFAGNALRRMSAALLLASLVVAGVGSISGANADVIPENKVTVTMEAFILDTNTTYQTINGQPTADGEFKNGSIARYPEGACVPVFITVTNEDDVSGDIALAISYDYSQNSELGVLSLSQLTTASLPDPGTADNLSDFDFTGVDLSSVTAFTMEGGGSVTSTISGPYAGDDGTLPTTNGDAERHYNMMLNSVPAGATVYVLICGQLDVDASEFGNGNGNGAQMSIRLGGNGQGAQNVAIHAGNLLVLPKLTLTKIVENYGVGTSTADLWSFVVNGVTYPIPPSGEVVIDNLPDGTYTIQEGVDPSLGDYQFQSGLGSGGCVFNNDTATVTLAASSTQQTATCEFTNEYVIQPPINPKLTVTKVVIGGPAQVSDFQLLVGGNNVASGVPIAFSTGTYMVTETSPQYLADYSGSFTGDCAPNGEVVLNVGDEKVCTLTNTYIGGNGGGGEFQSTTGTLTVIKVVVNDGGGTAQVSDFPLFVDEISVTSGVATVLATGTHMVTETGLLNYSAAYSGDCNQSGQVTINVGDEKVCTLTNTHISGNGGGGEWQATTGTLIVVKEVVNTNGGSSVASDFTINVTGTNPTLESFPGSASGTEVVLGAGAYSVIEPNSGAYLVSYSEDCSGVMATGTTVTCTVTNTYQGTSGGGGGEFQSTTGTLIVIKNVINTVNGTSTPSDFIINVTGTNPTLESFPGSASGTIVILEAGAYGVSEMDSGTYAVSYSNECNGVMATGTTVTCTITNREQIQEEDVVADLKLDKTGDSASLPSGTTLDYLLTLTNIGPEPATNAQVSDVLPSGFIYQSSVASQGSYNPATGIWTVGAMAVNDVVTLHIIVHVTAAAGDYTNTGVASALEFDPNLANNTETHTVTVTSASGGSRGGGGGSTIPTTGGGSSGGGGSTIPTTNGGGTPTPEVLGVTDVATGTTTTVPPPEPRVLGATDELPRTGMPAWMMLAAAVIAGATVRRLK